MRDPRLKLVGRGVGVALVAAVERVYLRRRAEPVGQARLTVGHVNMLGRAGDIRALTGSLRENRPAVFVVLEPDAMLSSQLGDGVTGALHAVSPLSPGRHRLRDQQLAAAGSWARAQPEPVVVLGDLNAVPWSAALHSLEHDAGLSSSSDGFGLQASWPSLAGFAGVPIDQLLTSRDLTATRRQTRSGFGSTRRSLWVELAFAAVVSD